MISMELKERIESFVLLGNFLNNFLDEKGRSEDSLYKVMEDATEKSGILNPWFTRESIWQALHAWVANLKKEQLEKWLEPYESQLSKNPARNVAVIMAGNIPLVGFHDFITVLLSGNHFTGRLSSGDTELLPALARALVVFNSEWAERITFTKERLTGFDAVIATGSNNSAHYFNYYIIFRNTQISSGKTGMPSRFSPGMRMNGTWLDWQMISFFIMGWDAGMFPSFIFLRDTMSTLCSMSSAGISIIARTING